MRCTLEADTIANNWENGKVEILSNCLNTGKERIWVHQAITCGNNEVTPGIYRLVLFSKIERKGIWELEN